MRPLKFSLVVATCENLGIGINNSLPWRLKSELQHFNRVTTRVEHEQKHNAVIMGRNTYFGIPESKRPLPKRLNIVLSSNENLDVPADVLVFSSLEKAMNHLETDETLQKSIENVWIAGGVGVYKEAMASDRCHRIYFTEIRKTFECDTFFPKIDLSRFEKIDLDDEDTPRGPQVENGCEYEIYLYQRIV